MLRRNKIAMVVCALTIVVARFQFFKNTQFHFGPTPKPPHWYVNDMRWASDPWTDDDSPYLAIEADVQRQMQGQTDVAPLLNQWRDTALRDMMNSQNLYRWAYATNSTVKPLDRVLGFSRDEKRWGQMFEVLLRPTSPSEYVGHDEFGRRLTPFFETSLFTPAPVRSYRYSRELFLAFQYFYHSETIDEDMKKLGERLLKCDPHDSQVKAVLFRRATTSLKNGVEQPIDTISIEKYTREMAQDDPGKAENLLLLARAQEFLWDYKKNDVGADKAIDLYSQYIQVTPAQTRYRAFAKRRTEELKHEKESAIEWRKEKASRRKAPQSD